MMNKSIPLIPLIISFLLAACPSDKTSSTDTQEQVIPAQGRADAPRHMEAADSAHVALELGPKDATRKSAFYLKATGFDLSRAQVEWLVNGRSVPASMPFQLDGNSISRGDIIQVVATLGDQRIESNTMQILNTPPEIVGIKIMPEVFKQGDTLSVEAEGKDLDGDEVKFYYEWTRNGEQAGKGANIEAPIKRGDKVIVKVTPFDGDIYGIPVIIDREIRNLPPFITESKEMGLSGNILTHQVVASDPDEDVLSFSLEGAPNGMTIDKASGLISWPVPTDFKGSASVTIVVNDDHSGTARCVRTFTIQ